MTAPAIHLSMLTVEEGYEDGFDAWYRDEHLPRTLAQPGWRRAHRYACTRGEPSYLTIHELDEGAGGTAVPFRDESVGRRVRDYRGETFRLVLERGAMSERPALLNAVVSDVEPDRAGAFDEWYSAVHVPEILGCPGWLSARRYASADSPSRFLAIYELSDEQRPFSSPEYDAAVGWDEHVGDLRGYHGFRVYRRRYTVERS
jgi:hypothetical protein